MEKERILVEVNDDRESVKVTLSPDSGSAGTVQLSEADLLALIRGLGSAREVLLEGKARPQLAGQEIAIVLNTEWAVRSERGGELAAFTFTHPAYGPLGFAVPIEQVEQPLIPALASQVAGVKEARGKR